MESVPLAAHLARCVEMRCLPSPLLTPIRAWSIIPSNPLNRCRWLAYQSLLFDPATETAPAECAIQRARMLVDVAKKETGSPVMILSYYSANPPDAGN